MFLKSLRIENEETLVREISFHKGINLIIDETRTSSATESGNNVGKTTVLRLIDFCLGGSGENIYKDPEFKNKSSNAAVEGFLKSHNIIITLTLKKDLDIPSSTEIEIKRNFLSRQDKLLTINGDEYSISDFPKKLKELIFGTNEEKPTFRQIISKNIRDEKNRLQNTIKVLHATTTREEYESLFLYWLGVPVDNSNRKQRILAELKVEENLQKRLKRESNYALLEQSLIILDRNIKELSVKKNSFNLNENYEQDLVELNQKKGDLNRLSTNLGQFEIRKELILESQEELRKEISVIDVEQVKSLYAEAKSLIPDLQKTFEETLTFHNRMINERVAYISKELPTLDENINSVKRSIDLLRQQEKHLTEKLTKSGAIEELQQIITDLNQAFEKKGNLEELKKLWDNTISKQESLKTELSTINLGIDSKDKLIKERAIKFNEYFSEISQRLYGEQFIMSPEKNDHGYELNISSLSGNLGTGKKKGQIAAFDLAYIQFADFFGIEHLNFILHDQIENIHDNQITSLLTEIVGGINCQYILPVLRDKLPDGIDVSQYVVLSLSQSDKLFRV